MIMKRIIIPILFFATCAFNGSLVVAAKSDVYTRGQLTVTTLPVSLNGDAGVYGTRSITAIWIQGPTDTTFVKTLSVMAGRRMINLRSWLGNSKTKLITAPVTNIYSFLEPDVITGATDLEHVLIDGTWSGKDPQGAIMPDGEYTVKLEMAQDNQLGYNASFKFTKGPAAVSLTPTDAVFSNLSIGWVPSVVLPDADAPTKPFKIYSSYVEAASCVLEWSDSQDNVAVSGYNIYNNGQLFSTSPANITSVKLPLTPETTYNFSIKARDESGNLSLEGPVVQVITPKDLIAPTAPSALYLVGSTSKTSTSLRWTGSTDNIGVTAYTVYKNGVVYGTPSTSTSSSLTGLVPGTSYNMTVTAKDANGNESVAGALTFVFDIVPPTAPTNLKTTAVSSNSISLGWTASTDNVGVAKYNVYKNNILISSTTSTSFDYTGLAPVTPYNLTVKAVDAAGYVTASLITLTVTTSEPTALSSIEANSKIILYSTNGQIVVDLSALAGHSVVSVTDVKGQLIKSVKINSATATILVPNNGIYVVTVQNEGKLYTRKVVVK